MKVLFIVALISFVHVISISCRVYDTRDEDDFDYVQVLDKRQLLSPSSRTKRATDDDDDDQLEATDHITDTKTKFNLTYSEHVFKKDSNNIAFVFWKSAYTKMIFILTCNNASTQTHSKLMNKGCHNQSNFYKSTNLGQVYEKSDVKGTPFDDHKLHSIYLSPLDNSFIIITDYQNKIMFITNNEGKTFDKIFPGFQPTFVLFHPKHLKLIAAFDNFAKSLWMSLDGGKTWSEILSRVRNYFWDETNSNSLYVEQETVKKNDSALFHVHVKGGYLVKQQLKKDLVKDSVYVGGGFVVVQQTSDSELHIAKIKTLTDLDFVKPKYSKNRWKPNLHYVIFSSDNNELVLGILHQDKTVTIYLSDEEGKSLRRLIGDVITERFDTSVKSKIPKIDYYRAKGTKNTYIVNIAHNWTQISFDKGYNWNILQFDKTDLNGNKFLACNTKCFLNLYIKVEKQYMDFSAPLLSKDSAPGIIMAQGNVKKSNSFNPINEGHKVWISINGGRTWRMTLERNYGFAFLDHGNFLAATPLTLNSEHSIHFSNNFGTSWLATEFTRHHTRIAAIITDASAKTLMINVFGFLYQHHSKKVAGDTWIVWQFNFTESLNRECKTSDYIQYPASGESCVLGEKIFFRRNKRSQDLTSTCYSPPKLNTSYTTSTPCECQKVRDFQCDEFYIYESIEGAVPPDFRCRPINENFHGLCGPDGYQTIPSGYRKLHGNKCSGGDDKLLTGTKKKCTGKLPTWIIIKASQVTVGIGEIVEFRMSPHEGSYQTEYTWDFGDSTKVSGTFKDMEKVKHAYYFQRQYTVKLIARYQDRSYTASLIIIVYDNTYHNAFIDYTDPAIAGKEITFSLKQLKRNGSRDELAKQTDVRFLWSFAGVYTTGVENTRVKHIFSAVGTYMVEVQVITPVNTQVMYRVVHVFQDAYVIEFEFSSKLDNYNSESATWMHDFMYKFKMFLAIKYEIHDVDRILVKGEAKKPTKVTAIICDTKEYTKSEQASVITKKIVADVNTNQPFLYGYGKEGIHVIRARKVGILEYKGDNKKNKYGNNAWVYVLLIILLIIAAVGGVLLYRYRHKRRCFLPPFGFRSKNDIMEKTLVYDIDDDYVGTEISEEPH